MKKLSGVSSTTLNAKTAKSSRSTLSISDSPNQFLAFLSKKGSKSSQASESEILDIPALNIPYIFNKKDSFSSHYFNTKKESYEGSLRYLAESCQFSNTENFRKVVMTNIPSMPKDNIEDALRLQLKSVASVLSVEPFLSYETESSEGELKCFVYVSTREEANKILEQKHVVLRGNNCSFEDANTQNKLIINFKKMINLSSIEKLAGNIDGVFKVTPGESLSEGKNLYLSAILEFRDHRLAYNMMHYFKKNKIIGPHFANLCFGPATSFVVVERTIPEKLSKPITKTADLPQIQYDIIKEAFSTHGPDKDAIIESLNLKPTRFATILKTLQQKGFDIGFFPRDFFFPTKLVFERKVFEILEKNEKLVSQSSIDELKKCIEEEEEAWRQQ